MTVARAPAPTARPDPGAHADPWAPQGRPWERWEHAAYNRAPDLSPTEAAALAEVRVRRAQPPAWKRWPLAHRRALVRLLGPLTDVLDATGAGPTQRAVVIGALVDAMARTQRAYWGWTREQWGGAVRGCGTNARQHLLAVGYLLCDQRDLYTALPGFQVHAFAARLFGSATVETSLARVYAAVRGWGYRPGGPAHELHRAVAVLLLASRSPHLEAITPEAFAAVSHRAMGRSLRQAFAAVVRALAALGIPPTAAAAEPLVSVADPGPPEAEADVPAEWLTWCRRWRDHSDLAPRTRKGHYHNLLLTGRWLARTRPELASPPAWTREAAAAYVAAVDEMVVGQWCHPLAHAAGSGRLGQPLAPATKAGLLRTLSTFFRDCQDWEWLRRRFDPRRVFATPRHLRAQLGTRPRVIAQDTWGKLLWAGLNLAAADIAPSPLHPFAYVAYPLVMVQAVAVTWLFAGLRADELRRLPLGCVRWQREDVTIPGTTDVLPKDAVCFLDVPPNKTSGAFTKPVDRPVGEAIAAWEAIRPAQPALRDRKTGQPTHYLFAYRGKRLGENYLNRVLIPLLCRKAGVPRRDARGPITSHRARSTIASMLFNARNPMSLFEIKAWLGHRYLSSTQHYVQVTPTRLAKAFADADYFARNLRTVEVLLDQDAVRRGAAARGEPWLYYDLGHGYCTHPYFAQCPHRLVCARCSFYQVKPTAKDLLLENRANLLRLRQEIPLTEDERAVVDEDLAGCEHLLAQLADVPALDGATPRQLPSQSATQTPAAPARGKNDRTPPSGMGAPPPQSPS
jgi:hypothetical protein